MPDVQKCGLDDLDEVEIVTALVQGLHLTGNLFYFRKYTLFLRFFFFYLVSMPNEGCWIFQR